jgi:hypothetical protein
MRMKKANLNADRPYAEYNLWDCNASLNACIREMEMLWTCFRRDALYALSAGKCSDAEMQELLNAVGTVLSELYALRARKGEFGE